jgi:hypothetical protein
MKVSFLGVVGCTYKIRIFFLTRWFACIEIDESEGGARIDTDVSIRDTWTGEFDLW